MVSRREVGASSLLSLAGGVVGIAMLAGGGALLLGEPEGPGAEPVVLALEAPVNAAVDGYTQTELTAPAGEAFVISSRAKTPWCTTSRWQPRPARRRSTPAPTCSARGFGDLTVAALDPGTYAYFCKYHPTTMTGTLTVKEGPPPGGPGGPTIDVRAEALAFDTDEIDLPADTPTTIDFDNADAGTTHNIAIYTDDTVTTAIFDGPDLLGPGSVDYPVPAIDAGEYYFHCDTHPTMFGSVVVEPAGGGGGGNGGGGGDGGGGQGGGSPPPSPPPNG